jgi:plasmid stabilization system protein ParE
MVAVFWPEPVWEVLRGLSEREQRLILEKVERLRDFPEMYPLRSEGPFRRCRWFVAGNWLVYYRFASGTVYIRGLWPARIPWEAVGKRRKD